MGFADYCFNSSCLLGKMGFGVCLIGCLYLVTEVDTRGGHLIIVVVIHSQ